MSLLMCKWATEEEERMSEADSEEEEANSEGVEAGLKEKVQRMSRRKW